MYSFIQRFNFKLICFYKDQRLAHERDMISYNQERNQSKLCDKDHFKGPKPKAKVELEKGE